MEISSRNRKARRAGSPHTKGVLNVKDEYELPIHSNSGYSTPELFKPEADQEMMISVEDVAEEIQPEQLSFSQPHFAAPVETE